jgi:hypothetical protein
MISPVAVETETEKQQRRAANLVALSERLAEAAEAADRAHGLLADLARRDAAAIAGLLGGSMGFADAPRWSIAGPLEALRTAAYVIKRALAAAEQRRAEASG